MGCTCASREPTPLGAIADGNVSVLYLDLSPSLPLSSGHPEPHSMSGDAGDAVVRCAAEGVL